MLLASQVRAARGLLNWSQAQLAQAAAVGESTVRNFEAGRSTPMGNNLAAIRRTLEAAGVEFTNGGQPGVRLRKGAGTPAKTPAERADTRAAARGKAETAIDKALAGMEAANGDKARRKRKLTRMPKGLKQPD